MIRYRFSDFTLSPQRRLLVRDGREVPLIPRYFDLLLLLIERRHEAVHRREIFDRVWGEVIVSESALSQAVRTIRRTLGDDSQEPRFIRTVSRHGYQFVLDVIEEHEEHDAQPASQAEAPGGAAIAIDIDIDADRRDAPMLWIRAATGGALAGIAAGGMGGLILAAAPGSAATFAIAPVLAVIGGGCGALGGAGVGAGLALAGRLSKSPSAVADTKSPSAVAGTKSPSAVADTESPSAVADTESPSAVADTESPSAVALVAGAALGGGLVGTAAQWLARWGLAALLGLDIDVGGGLEGVAIGGAAGAGYAFATGTRLRAALITAVFCGLAGLALTLAGYPLVGGTIHTIADATSGSRATLTPLGRLIGEPDFGPVSRAIIAFGEGALFGVGLAYGLRRRPPG